MSNPKSPLSALHILITSSIGKMIIAALIWGFTYAYAAGALRYEVDSMGKRLDRIEQKLDALDTFIRDHYNLIQP